MIRGREPRSRSPGPFFAMLRPKPISAEKRIEQLNRLLSREPDAEKAETCFARALSGAREQQAKSWELLAAVSAARLWRNQGKHQQARDALASVYGWFTEGFETDDLRGAKALLDELASCQDQWQGGRTPSASPP